MSAQAQPQTQNGFAPGIIEEKEIAQTPFSMGVLTAQTGALPPELWVNSHSDQILVLLKALPARPSSSIMADLTRRLLLSPTSFTQTSFADTGTSTGTSFGAQADVVGLSGAKLLALVRTGFTDEARTIASLSNAERSDAGVNRALAEADLLDGDLNAACKRNSRVTGANRASDFWLKIRILCYAKDEEYDAADLTLGLLREQGGLTDEEIDLFTAVSIPAPLKKPITPISAVHLAAMQQIASPLPGSFLYNADVGVLAAVARNEKIDIRLRIGAGEQAFYAGTLSLEGLTDLYRNAVVDDQNDLDKKKKQSETNETFVNDALAGARVFETLQSLPPQTKDRQVSESLNPPSGVSLQRLQIIGDAINSIDNPYSVFAIAKLFKQEIDGVVSQSVTPAQASGLSLANMLNGDAERAGKWLLVMLGQGLSSLDQQTGLAFLERSSLLAVLDKQAASVVAASADVTLSDAPTFVQSAVGSNSDELDPLRLASHIEAALDGAAAGALGQKILAAIVLADDASHGDLVADVAARASLRAAGQKRLTQRHAFEIAWRSGYANGSEATVVSSTINNEDAGLSPRLKP